MEEIEYIENQKIKIHADHKRWMSEVEFYEDEIEFFLKELNAVLLKNEGSFSMMENVAEYQGILKKKKLKLETIREEIEFQKRIFDVDEIMPENIEYHLILKEKFTEVVSNFEKIKKNLKRFASHND